MRYIVVTFTLCLLVVSSYAGTYVDTFEDGDLNGWAVVDYCGGAGSVWEVENGVLAGRRQAVCSAALVFGENEWRNYIIECDAKMVEELPGNWHSMGLDLRVPIPNNGSDVWLIASKTSRTAWIWPYLNGGHIGQSAQKAFDLELNRWYRLKGVANEQDFEFYIDGELVASLSIPRAPETGCVGFAVQGSVVHFDNLVITGDDVPDNTAAVSPSGKLATTWGQLRSRNVH